jgi:hypothetical protein
MALEAPAKLTGETPPPPRWIGILFLLGCFAGLCALFLLLVTAGVAWQEQRQKQWPEATATIQECGLEVVGRRQPSYIIVCRVLYRANGRALVSKVHSLSSPIPGNSLWESAGIRETFDRMQDWVELHPAGKTMAVRYDPANPAKAVLTETDMPRGGPQTAGNLRLLEGVAGLTAVLLAIAVLARRLWASRNAGESAAGTYPPAN